MLPAYLDTCQNETVGHNCLVLPVFTAPASASTHRAPYLQVMSGTIGWLRWMWGGEKNPAAASTWQEFHEEHVTPLHNTQGKVG
jgi:hypothetical protein